MSYLKAFTTLLSNFLAELAAAFPEETELKTYRNATDALIKANPKLVHKMFNKYVMPYKEQILKRDETFFLNNSFEKEQAVAAANDMNLLEAVRIKQLWSVMSGSSKDNASKYLCQLVQVAERA